MKVICLFAGLQLLLVFSVFPQLNFDSLKQEVASSSNDSIKASILIDIGKGFTNSYPDSAYYYQNKALKISRRIKDDFLIAKAAQLI